MIILERISRAIRRRAARLSDGVVGRSWILSTARTASRFRKNHPDTAVKILIHQMGRVGSRSLEKAVGEHLTTGATVYHVHFLNTGTIDTMERRLREQHRLSGRAEVPDQFIAAKYLNAKLRKRTSGAERWKIVSLVRDPMVRHVSAFFQFFPTYFPELPDGYHCDPGNVDELAALLIKRGGEDREHMLNWFDLEVREPFGIDIFQSAFPHEKGYQIASGPNADLLVLRLEDMERTAPVAVSEFLGIEGFSVSRVNVGSRKAYGEAYRAFRRDVALPESLLDEVYGSRLARHFYSETEIETFRGDWTALDGD